MLYFPQLSITAQELYIIYIVASLAIGIEKKLIMSQPAIHSHFAGRLSIGQAEHRYSLQDGLFAAAGA